MVYRLGDDKVSAKEMFEKLGYEEIKLTDDGLVALYEKIIFGDRQSIYFYPEKSVRIIFHSGERIYPPIIDSRELQAINKQVEELGWNNEK